MTYLEFHYIFTFPLLALLVFITQRAIKKQSLAGHYRPENAWVWRFFWLMPVIATVYTTPWDNYLIYKKVWTYPPERVWFTIGYVPFEEHLFFVVQSLIGGLWLFFLMRRIPKAQFEAESQTIRPIHRYLGAGVFGLLSLLGSALLFSQQGLYMGLILAWAGPVLAFLWAFGGDLFVAHRKLLWWGFAVPTLYLAFSDTLAIVYFGIWDINTQYSLPFRPLGLPIEEFVFFLVTTLLVIKGLMLFLHPLALPRALNLARHFKPWLGLLLLYALLKIPVPLIPQEFPLLANLSTGALALSALLWGYSKLGKKVVLLAGLAFGMGLGIEILGSRTGFPFGVYSYHAPSITLWGVPLIVPLGWWAMTFSATVLARGNVWYTGLLLVAWDVGLEPLMIDQGYWTWQEGGFLSFYHGVPLQNFIAWFAVGVLIAWVFQKIAPEIKQHSEFACAYRIESLFLPCGLLLMGYYPAAVVTLLAMNALAWRKLKA